MEAISEKDILEDKMEFVGQCSEHYRITLISSQCNCSLAIHCFHTVNEHQDISIAGLNFQAGYATATYFIVMTIFTAGTIHAMHMTWNGEYTDWRIFYSCSYMYMLSTFDHGILLFSRCQNYFT